MDFLKILGVKWTDNEKKYLTLQLNWLRLVQDILN